MSAADLFRHLTGRGVVLKPDGLSLVVERASLLTDRDRNAIRANRDGLLAIARELADHDPLPNGARQLLGAIDWLGPLTIESLATVVRWRRGETIGMLLRLQDLGVVRRHGERWALTAQAERFALGPRDGQAEGVQ
jgi:hypothetical protein